MARFLVLLLALFAAWAAALTIQAHAQLVTAPAVPPVAAFTFAAVPPFSVQAKVPGRVTVVPGGRDGTTALRLHTEPGDANIFGSGVNERADVALTQAQTGCTQGAEQWWAHSMLFPGDFSLTGGWGQAVFDFHHTLSGGGQANLEIGVNSSGMMNLHGNGGKPTTPTWRVPEFSVNLGIVQRNVWYDMVYHVKWSSGPDGFIDAWQNGARKLSYRGPTIYAGQGCYLKLQNYRVPNGKASSVIHDRVVMGKSACAVAVPALEGVTLACSP